MPRGSCTTDKQFLFLCVFVSIFTTKYLVFRFVYDRIIENSTLNPQKIILPPVPAPNSSGLCLPHLPHFEVYICDDVRCWCTVDISGSRLRSGRDEELPPATPPPFGPPPRKLETRDGCSRSLLSSDFLSVAAHAVIGSRTAALSSLFKCFVAVLLVWPEVVAGFLAGLVCTIQWPSHLGHQLCAQGGHSWTGELCSTHFVCQKLSSVCFHLFCVVYFFFFQSLWKSFSCLTVITSSRSLWFKAAWAARHWYCMRSSPGG